MDSQTTSSLFRTITKENPYKICFVCLGNICRSPTAEGIMQHLVKGRHLDAYFEIDSAGTSAYHIGESPNSKSRKVATRHGVELLSRARQFAAFDLEYFDLILAMDEENYADICSLDWNKTFIHRVFLLRNFDPKPEDQNVPDPYYGGSDGFEHVFQVIHRSCVALIDQLQQYVDL